MSNCYPLGRIVTGLLFVLTLAAGHTLRAQSPTAPGFKYKVQLINADTLRWGVFVKYDNGYVPTPEASVTGGATATLKVHHADSLVNLVPVEGPWTFGASGSQAYAYRPTEAPDNNYYQISAPSTFVIDFASEAEVLLFTFESHGGVCLDSINLMDGYNDPFLAPNTQNSNPGNVFDVFDGDNSTHLVAGWVDNYALSAWSCEDCDLDGILNAFEDTNGDGQWTPAEDASHLCDACDPLHVETAFLGEDGTICAGDAYDLTVDIAGPWPPYTLTYSDGTSNDLEITNYNSGDAITLTPAVTTTYTLLNVVDAMGCEIDPDSIGGGATVTVEGPFAIDTQPASDTDCAGADVTFSVGASNAGDGVLLYQWYRNTGSGWTALDGTAPYSGENSSTLTVNNVQATMDGDQFRVEVSTEACALLQSAVVTLSVEGAISIDTEPQDAAVCAPAVAQFSANVSSTGGSGSIAYQWEESTDGGTTWTALTDNGTYSNTTTATLSVVSAASSNGYRYRVVVGSATCSQQTSEPALLTVSGPLTLTTDVVDADACAGTGAQFLVGVDHPGNGGAAGVLYQWEQRTSSGAAWLDLSNDGNINGVHSATLSIDDVTGMDGYQFRVHVRTPECSETTSAVGTLHVSGPLTLTTQPTDAVVCATESAVFTAASTIGQGTLTRRWERQAAGTTTWTPLTNAAPYSGTDTDVLTVANTTAAMHGDRFRLRLGSPHCADVLSLVVDLGVEGPLSVSSQDPATLTQCAGLSQEIEVVIDNPGGGTVQYRWQIGATDGFGNPIWVNLNNNATYGNVDGNVLLISDVVGLDGNDYLLTYWTDACAGVATAGPFSLTVEGPVGIVLDPTDHADCSGNAASFTGGADLPDNASGTLLYQWQFSVDNGTNWNALSDGGVYTGTTTTTLQISDNTGLDGYQYRLRASTAACTVPVSSLPATLFEEGPITIAAQPADANLCAGNSTVFFVDVDNPNSGTLTYQWQVDANADGTYEDLLNGPAADGATYNGVTTDTLSISEADFSLNEYRYRVVVSTENCAVKVPSAYGTLFLQDEVSVSDLLPQRIVCAGSTDLVSVTVTPATTSYTLQWEYRATPGDAWADLANGSPPAGSGTVMGANGLTLQIANVPPELNGYQFRAKIQPEFCDEFTTNVSTLVVEGPISIDVSPADAAVCGVESASFSVAVSNAAAGVLSFQWEMSDTPADAGSWVGVPNNALYNGATSTTLSVSNTSGMDGRHFRVRVSTGACATVTSTAAALTVEGPLRFDENAGGTQPSPSTICSDDAASTFTATAVLDNNGTGTITYQWQVSTDDLNYTDILAGNALYSGQQTNTLTVVDPETLNGTWYRLEARTTECNPVYSNGVQLTVEGAVAFATDGQPQDVVTCDGTGALFFVDVDNGNLGALQFQWDVSTDGGTTWSGLANEGVYNGVTTDTLSIDDVAGLYNTTYRVRIQSGVCSQTVSDAATLSVEGPLAVETAPADVDICDGGSAAFSVDFSDGGANNTPNFDATTHTPSTTWQVSTNGGSTWTDLTPGADVAVSTTNDGTAGDYTFTTTLTLTNATFGMHNHRYRAVLGTSACAPLASPMGRLRVAGPLSIAGIGDQLVCDNLGTEIEATVAAGNVGTLSLQWQVDDGSGMTSIANDALYQGATTAKLFIDDVDGLHNHTYQLVASIGACSTTSNLVTLTTQSDTIGVCDFDLDGLDNDTDLDDDADGLTDSVEVYIATMGDDGYYSQFDTDSDDDLVPDGQEDADDDTISNLEETDDDDGDGLADGIDPTTGAFTDGLLDTPQNPDPDDVSNGDPLDPCDPIISPSCIGIELTLRVKLQGAMINNGGGALMRDDLRALDYLPLTNPYDAMPQYTVHGDGGGETITDPGVLNVTGDDAIVDWVFVELRSNVNLEDIVETKSALVQRDGDVVEPDGVTPIQFPNTPAGSYFVSVRHRNHLGAMTNETTVLSPQPQLIDFTDASLPLLGEHAMRVDPVSGERSLWAGDYNADGATIYRGPNNDNTTLLFYILLHPNQTANPPLVNFFGTGYHGTDLDMNGSSVFQGPNNEQSLMLFQVILQHPGNPDDLTNAAILQQLP